MARRGSEARRARRALGALRASRRLQLRARRTSSGSCRPSARCSPPRCRSRRTPSSSPPARCSPAAEGGSARPKPPERQRGSEARAPPSAAQERPRGSKRPAPVVHALVAPWAGATRAHKGLRCRAFPKAFPAPRTEPGRLEPPLPPEQPRAAAPRSRTLMKPPARAATAARRAARRAGRATTAWPVTAAEKDRADAILTCTHALSAAGHQHHAGTTHRCSDAGDEREQRWLCRTTYIERVATAPAQTAALAPSAL